MSQIGAQNLKQMNAFTVDVEDYFQVSAFEHHIPKAAWATQPQRVAGSTSRLLDLLERFQICGTFFTLGWVAERNPQLIRRIVDAGHELASHGYDHTRVTEMQPHQFRADVIRTKHLLEDIAGKAIRGYRAPTFSFTRDNHWVYDVLAESEHHYSSSVAPIRHDLYGIPDAPRHAYRHRSGIIEIPLSTVRIGGINVPCGGGGFFRLYPYPITRWCINRVNRREAQACNFYMHPWELDPEQPRQSALPLRTRFRHYLNLRRVKARLERLLSDFSWGRMDQVFLSGERL